VGKFFVSIVVTVALCIAFLVFVAEIRLSTAGLVILALGLPMLAAVFAGISALGPKFSPSPTLTPIMAWVLTPVIATFMTVGYLKATQDRASSLHPTDVATVSEMIPTVEPEDALVPDKAVAPPAETGSQMSQTASPPRPAAGMPTLSQPVTAPLPGALASPEIGRSVLFSDGLAVPNASAAAPSMETTAEAITGSPPLEALAVPGAFAPAPDPSMEAAAEAIVGSPRSEASTVPGASVPASDPSIEATADVPLPSDRSAEPIVPPVAAEVSSREPGTSDTAIVTAPPVPRSRPCGGVWPPCAGSTEPVSSTTIW
jgi:hypothetical protein